ncbi:MAG: DUF2330 domain-containing protein [Phycisphaerae bacterium]|jgi:hypothetical protein|nr:DUF2330 domain-containing protein [Phycisphaerae bacterium]
MPRACFVVAVGVLLFVSAAVFADGKYFSNTKSIARDPRMPSQAAIIGHRNGVETLIIESGVESDGTPLAWVVPLPAVPSEIGHVSPGAVATALELTSPAMFDADRERSTLRQAAIALPVALGLGLLLSWASRRGLLSLVAAALALLAFSCLLLPALATARGFSPTPGVSVLRSVTAGIYDVEVVRASDPEALITWLTERDFAVPASARSVIAAYVRDGWVFCAASVALGKGEAAPHPLKLSFPSESIVYPMRLTAAVGDAASAQAAGNRELDLDLVVFSSAPVTHPALRTWVTASQSQVAESDEPRFWYRQSDPAFGHPDLVPMAAMGPWVTRLHGHLDLATVTDDFVLVSGEPRRERVRLATRGDVMLVSVTATLLALAVAMVGVVPFLDILRRTRMAPEGDPRVRLTARWSAIGFACLSVALGTAYAWAGISPLQVHSFVRLEGPHPRERLNVRGDVELALLEGKDEATLRAILNDRLVWQGPDHEVVSREGLDQPLGWSVETDGDVVTVTLYDEIGHPWTIASGQREWKRLDVREPSGSR